MIDMAITSKWMMALLDQGISRCFYCARRATDLKPDDDSYEVVAKDCKFEISYTDRIRIRLTQVPQP